MAGRSILWSALQNWGSKIFSFLLSILLARLLSPEEFGIAAAASLVLLLVPLIAEMGFGDAIMQRRGLKPTDANLPFALATCLAVILVSIIAIFREPIAAWAGLGDRTNYLLAIAATLLISVPSMFQEAMYKHHMRFRDLALRSFAANLCGGLLALFAALAGFGVWTFVVQAYATLLVNVVWIWWRPQWLPSLEFDWLAFRQMFRFGTPIVAQRLVDFAGTRTLDIIIISQIGLAAYGIYIVGARLYQTMMQLLQSAFYDVSLTVLSTISNDRARIAEVYRKTIALSASTMSPILVLIAALSPEICDVLFGNKWVGVDMVAQPLLLMAAVHCVQYMNGAFLSARGKPELVLVTGVLKSILQIVAVLWVGGSDVSQLTQVFVIAALLSAPISFAMVARELGLTIGAILRLMVLPAMLSAAAFAAVYLARFEVASHALPTFWQGMVLGGLFAGVYLCLLAIFDRQKTLAFLGHAGQLVRRVRPNG